MGVDDREVAAELQSLLVELIDLTLVGKQAHWNVQGPHCRSIAEHPPGVQVIDTTCARPCACWTE